MQVINNEMVVGWDMDDTLVMWDNPTVDGPGKVKIEFAGGHVYLTPHNYHIQLLKVHKERGYFNIGWSANGKDHVQRIAKALDLEPYFDLAMTKLTKHFDDSTGSVVGTRVYVDDLTKPPPEPVVWTTILPEGQTYGPIPIPFTPYKPFGSTSG